MTDGSIDALTDAVRDCISREGATRESLARFLAREQGLARADAEALAHAICGRLLADRFPAITQMELMLTEDCNQRCDYCFVEGKNRGNRMSWGVARQAVDFLFTHSRGQAPVRILFFGGEPMLEFDLIRQIAVYAGAQARERGGKVEFNMTTNGTLLDEARAAFLAEQGVSVLLSIDGDRSTHDRHRKTADGTSSYERVVGNLPAMKRHQPWLGTRMTVHPDTVGRLSSNVEHLAGLGLMQFLIGPATGQAWSDAALAEYRRQMIEVCRWLKRQLEAGRALRVTPLEETPATLSGRRHIWGCRAGRHAVSVNARGALYPCSKMLGVDRLKGVMPLGTLTDGITQIHNRLALCGMLPVTREACAGCRLIDMCMGGCYACNYQATGSVFQPDPLECRVKACMVEITREAAEILGPCRDRLAAGVSGAAENAACRE
ncbi:MAG: radical SAM protein [Kiritimatiellae bacterium]|nr:radical SAM protein [Kiritimatiellia bacterium]